ncbi:MAG: HlyD family efflux transporter periplasmic adaptor subunit [Sphingomonas sp.]|nr:HlyD family efflux transporter periplasmic adaptor subunit [Sphingomonas sp.]MBW0006529.1 HlyD family efflux transporter periplasmic adaptor subunit [Sphingomonas sp.]
MLHGETQQVEPTEAEAAAVKSADPRRKKVLLGLTGAFLLAGGGWYMFHDTGHVSTDNAYVGAESAQVTPLIAAAVTDVPVVNTQYVHKGDVLLRLDDSDFKLAVEKAEAAYLKARRQYQQSSATSGSLAAQVGARAADIGQAQAQFVAAQSTVAKAKADLDRREHLAGDGFVSREELTSFRNAYVSAQSNLREAQAAIAQAQANRGAAQESYAANQALIAGTSVDTSPDVAAAKAALDQARLDLSRTIIRAPMDGVVTNRQVQVGQRLAAGNSVMTIVPTGAVYVDANFKEGQLTRVQPGQPAELVSDLYGSKTVFHGKVVGFAGGTGSAFALIPAQNATGNWIKVVQRLPVRIQLDPKELASHPLRVGLSMEATVDVSRKDRR